MVHIHIQIKKNRNSIIELENNVCMRYAVDIHLNDICQNVTNNRSI